MPLLRNVLSFVYARISRFARNLGGLILTIYGVESERYKVVLDAAAKARIWARIQEKM